MSTIKFIKDLSIEAYRDKGFGASIFVLLFLLYAFVSWFVNIYMFLTCDFEGPWKDEIIHGLGLWPILSWITVWF